VPNEACDLAFGFLHPWETGVTPAASRPAIDIENITRQDSVWHPRVALIDAGRWGARLCAAQFRRLRQMGWIVQHSKLRPNSSPHGVHNQHRPLARPQHPQKADLPGRAARHFVPRGDVSRCSKQWQLFDHFVGAAEERKRRFSWYRKVNEVVGTRLAAPR
jgi:hypothetical protein